MWLGRWMAKKMASILHRPYILTLCNISLQIFPFFYFVSLGWPGTVMWAKNGAEFWCTSSSSRGLDTLFRVPSSWTSLSYLIGRESQPSCPPGSPRSWKSPLKPSKSVVQLTTHAGHARPDPPAELSLNCWHTELWPKWSCFDPLDLGWCVT